MINQKIILIFNNQKFKIFDISVKIFQNLFDNFFEEKSDTDQKL